MAKDTPVEETVVEAPATPAEKTPVYDQATGAFN